MKGWKRDEIVGIKSAKKVADWCVRLETYFGRANWATVLLQLSFRTNSLRFTVYIVRGSGGVHVSRRRVVYVKIVQSISSSLQILNYREVKQLLHEAYSQTHFEWETSRWTRSAFYHIYYPRFFYQLRHCTQTSSKARSLCRKLQKIWHYGNSIWKRIKKWNETERNWRLLKVGV